MFTSAGLKRCPAGSFHFPHASTLQLLLLLVLGPWSTASFGLDPYCSPKAKETRKKVSLEKKALQDVETPEKYENMTSERATLKPFQKKNVQKRMEKPKVNESTTQTLRRLQNLQRPSTSLHERAAFAVPATQSHGSSRLRSAGKRMIPNSPIIVRAKYQIPIGPLIESKSPASEGGSCWGRLSFSTSLGPSLFGSSAFPHHLQKTVRLHRRETGAAPKSLKATTAPKSKALLSWSPREVSPCFWEASRKERHSFSPEVAKFESFNLFSVETAWVFDIPSLIWDVKPGVCGVDDFKHTAMSLSFQPRVSPSFRSSIPRFR